jgi:hypothetical protein
VGTIAFDGLCELNETSFGVDHDKLTLLAIEECDCLPVG